MPPKEEPPFPTGYIVRGRKVIVQMSDGTVRIERDKELTNVERNSVTLDGKKLFFRARPRETVPPSPALAPVLQAPPVVPQSPVADPQPVPSSTAHEIPGKSTYRL